MHTGEKEFIYTTKEATSQGGFHLTETDIADIIGEAKKYEIDITEKDLWSYEKRATQLFKQKSITSDII